MMIARHCDIAILGGGLAGGLIALAFARLRPDLSLLLVEQDERLGGNHVWSFFGSDVGKDGRALIAPMVAGAWPGYDVRFPAFARGLETSYYSITSERFDVHLRATLSAEAIVTGLRVLECTEASAMLSDGSRIEAGAVIDARGIRNLGHLTGGWQKFYGKYLKLSAPHGLDRPIIMDATVAQFDGFRFVYSLPFGPNEIFVEDTYYSDSATLDTSVLSGRIDAYVAAQGWQVGKVLGDEHGVLPVVAGGDFDGFWRSTGPGTPRAGTRAGLFHAVTSYSLPDAVRFALTLAEEPHLDGQSLAKFSEVYARNNWQKTVFYRKLSAMLFAAAEPIDRYRVLERFYRLDRRLIERFYAGHTTTMDKLRILAGRPPVPIGRAIGVLTGLGAKPQPLTLAAMRK